MKLLVLFLAVAAVGPLRSSPASAQAALRVCAGSPLPPGWIKVDDAWDPTSCGNPTAPIANVAIVARFDDKPAGAVMVACTGPVPFGWVMVGRSWNPSACGRPTAQMDNVMQIRKVPTRHK